MRWCASALRAAIWLAPYFRLCSSVRLHLLSQFIISNWDLAVNFNQRFVSSVLFVINFWLDFDIFSKGVGGEGGEVWKGCSDNVVEWLLSFPYSNQILWPRLVHPSSPALLRHQISYKCLNLMSLTTSRILLKLSTEVLKGKYLRLLC